MKRVRFLVAAGMGVMIAGCAQQKHREHHAEAPPAQRPATAPPSTQSSEAESPASPEILQQRTQSYAESMQQLLHPQTQPTAAATTAPVVSSTPAPAPQPATSPSPPAPQLEAVPSAAPPSVEVAINPPVSPTTQATQAQSSRGNQRPGESLTQRIDQQADDQPHDAAAQLDQQLLAFVRGDSVPDENALAPLSTNEREVLSALLDGLTNYRDVIRNDPTATTARKLQPLLDMADRIHSQADLSIPAIALCSAVRSYGDYDVMNADALPAAQVTRALVYCQVTNFASQLSNQRWETRFSERVALYSEQTGKAVWNKAPQAIVDHCKQRRHDCYCVEQIDLPAGLATGKYVLSVTIEDQLANKIAQGTIPIGIKGE